MSDLLRIEPRAITFPASLGFTSKTNLHLVNPSHNKVTYWIVAPENNAYSAHPHSGTIVPWGGADVTLTQRIDLALSDTFNGRQRYILHVAQLMHVPSTDAKGPFHGYPSLAQMWKAVPQTSVRKEELVVNGLFGDLGPACEQDLRGIGSGLTLSAKDNTHGSDSPLSVSSLNERVPKHLSKAPVFQPKKSGTEKNSRRQTRAENLATSFAATNTVKPNAPKKPQLSQYQTNMATDGKRTSNNTSRVPERFYRCIRVPPKITFDVKPGRESCTTLRIRNTSKSRFAYTVLTNNLERYGVRPNMGTLEPQSKVDIIVTQRSSPLCPEDISDCNDLFLLKVGDIDVSSGGVLGLQDKSKSVADVWKAIPNEAVRSTFVGVQMRKAGH